MTETNGQNGQETKGPNRVKELHDQFVKNGGKVPPDAEVKRLVANYKKAHSARVAAQTAFEAAKKAESETVEAIILAVGKGRIKIAGKVLIPMSKGDSVYFRTEGGGEVRDLG